MSVVYGEDKIPYIDLGKNYRIRLEYEDIVDEYYLNKAKEELRETPELKQQALEELRELVKIDSLKKVILDVSNCKCADKDACLRQATEMRLFIKWVIDFVCNTKNEKKFVHPLEDPFLETYLRPSKFYAKSAFEKMQKYFKFKLKHKKHCEKITVDSVRNVLEDDLLKYMPLRDKHGRRILYMQCGNKWNPQRVGTVDIFRAMQLSLQAAMAEPMTQVNGVCAIMDMEGLSLSQILHFTPSYAAMVLEWVQECIPIRLKQIYIVNNSYIFNMLFAIFKPFISAKLRKRIHFINKHYEVLADDLGKHCLGEDFGGNLPIGYVSGKVLADLLKLFDKQFELIDLSGYGEEDMDERQKRIEEGVEEVLSYIKAK